jgi:SAM-dependent methyltransferase
MSAPERCDFEQIEREERPQAKRIAQYLRDLRWLPMQTVNTRILDVGCGPGLYVEELRAVGFDAYGVDNDERMPKQAWYRHVDLANLSGADLPSDDFDIVLSLEVGEHLPEKVAEDYVTFIARTDARVVYFSAARPGQGGIGHINCQPRSYWSRLFALAGFYLDPEGTESFLSFMRAGAHMGWLAHPQLGNGMVFKRCAA